MVAALKTETNALEYRFDGFRLIPAVRELWNGDELLRVAPLVFDCMAYLLLHRDRLVGRDELISAVWGKTDIADVQVRKVIARARRLVGDDARGQVIHTAPGIGYRWVGAITQCSSIGSHARASRSTLSAASAAAGAPPTAEETAREFRAIATASRRGRWKTAVWLVGIAGLVCMVLAYAFAQKHRSALVSADPSAPATAMLENSIVVLPLDVTAPEESGWVRLGGMDLIAQRLRSAGMVVPPSDDVVSAARAIGEPIDTTQIASLRRTLGVKTTVQGTAVKSAEGWKVELEAIGADGLHRSSEAERRDVTEASRQAADLLLAAFGNARAIHDDEANDEIEELLQRAGAAVLANHLDIARSILSSAGETVRNDVRVRLELAQVDQRAGNLDQAESDLTSLLGDPALKAQPALGAQAFVAMGSISMLRNDCPSAQQRFDAALKVLASKPVHLEAGIALAARGAARACEHQFPGAIADLSEAGPILQASGARLTMAQLDNNFGALEFYRRRPAEAVSYLQAASEIDQSFGAINPLHNDLSLLCLVDSELLQWQDASSASERLWALHPQMNDAGTRYLMAGLRARVLIHQGLYGESENLLRNVENANPNAHGPLALTFFEANAELAWGLGDAHQAMAAIKQALDILPPSQMTDDEDVVMLLIRQRASFAMKESMQADTKQPLSPAIQNASPVYFVALAERAAHDGRFTEAERSFRQASEITDVQAVPSNTVLVADAYARWLLARSRVQDAVRVAGRVTPWADRDFDSALLQVAVLHASAEVGGWAKALKTAQSLAGERKIPDLLLSAPR